MGEVLTAAGLFAGIGGVEVGLRRAGIECELLCEWWDPAKAVLEHRFPGVPLVADVRSVRSLPRVDVLAAGFPCTDLSQAGRTRGISGEASGLVGEVFRLLRRRRVPWVVLENVRNMLVLDKGDAMEFLVSEFESLGYRWAYRLVDSRFSGVPQRRQRVIFVASRVGDPRNVLFADDENEPSVGEGRSFGFYWTEGLRGLGWAVDAVPTLKGGSTIGIPSPPAIWNPSGDAGRRIVTPLIEDAEALQGFDRGWTKHADKISGLKGSRWRLVGNAVTVGVSSWLGSRLVHPGESQADLLEVKPGAPWPLASFGENGRRWAAGVSLWPMVVRGVRLDQVVDLGKAPPLSLRATSGFYSRALRGNLRFPDGFLDAVASHIDAMAAA